MVFCDLLFSLKYFKTKLKLTLQSFNSADALKDVFDKIKTVFRIPPRSKNPVWLLHRSIGIDEDHEQVAGKSISRNWHFEFGSDLSEISVDPIDDDVVAEMLQTRPDEV